MLLYGRNQHNTCGKAIILQLKLKFKEEMKIHRNVSIWEYNNNKHVKQKG